MKISNPVLFFSLFMAAQTFAAVANPKSKTLVQFRRPNSTSAPIEGDLISRDFREAVFKAAELKEYVTDLDELDQDILIMAIWKKPITEVEKKYPKIPARKLENAQQIIKETLK